MNILLAIDGSSASDRAARHVVQLAGQLQSPPMLLMVNVAAPLLPQAARKLGRKSTAEYYARGSEYAVRKARSILDRAGVAYRSEEHTSALQPLLPHSYAVFSLK